MKFKNVKLEEAYYQIVTKNNLKTESTAANILAFWFLLKEDKKLCKEIYSKSGYYRNIRVLVKAGLIERKGYRID